jgi:hypothetical protein
MNPFNPMDWMNMAREETRDMNPLDPADWMEMAREKRGWMCGCCCCGCRRGRCRCGGRDRTHDRLCAALQCLLEQGTLDEFFENNDIDPAEVRRCLELFCEDCIDFSAFEPKTDVDLPFVHEGVTFSAVNPSASANSFVDWWPPGTPDGRSELPFPESGIEMEVPTTSLAEVDVATFAEDTLVLEAYDDGGTQLDSDSVSAVTRTRYTLRVRGDGITDLVLKGGRNEAILLQVCLGATGRRRPNENIE